MYSNAFFHQTAKIAVGIFEASVVVVKKSKSARIPPDGNFVLYSSR